MLTLLLRFLLFISLVLLPGLARADGWTAPYRDQTNRNSTIDQPDLSFQAAGSVPSRYSQPVVYGGYIVTTISDSSGNQVVAYDLETLAIQWKYQLETTIPGPLMIDRNSVYFGSITNPAVYSLNLLNGELRWQSPLPKSSIGIRLPIIGIADSLFVASDRLYQFSTDGSPVWQGNYDIKSPMATDDRSLYFRIHAERLIKLNPLTHQEEWSYQTNTTHGTHPVIYGQSVYMGTYQKVIVLDRQTGLLEWQVDTGLTAPLIGTLSTLGSYLAIGTSDGMIRVYKDRQLVWRYRSPLVPATGWQSSFLVTGSRLIAQVDPANHRIFDLDSGLAFWQGKIGGATGQLIGVAEKHLLIKDGQQVLIIKADTWQTAPIAESRFQPDLNPVVVIPGILESWPVNGEWRLDPFLKIFDRLLATLRQAGYIDNQNLFLFPYDWHRDNHLTAELLARKIVEIKERTGAQNVDIIAHSMGGLVARAYIQSRAYVHDVDRLITIGSPHAGSVKSYLTWEGAETGSGMIDQLKEQLLHYEARKRGYQDTIEYIHSHVKSIQQLLPIFDYATREGTSLVYRPCQNWLYPCNPFLEELDTELDRLLQRVTAISVVGELVGDTTLSRLDLTPVSERPPWQHGMPLNYPQSNGLFYGKGDGTVLLTSARLKGSPIVTLPANHTDLVGKSASQIVQRLTGRLVDTPELQKPKKLLFLKLFSPVDMTVTDQEGRQTGRTATGGIVNSIPDSYYNGNQTDEEFIILADPADSQYTVEIEGRGVGEYRIEASVIGDGEQQSGSVTAQTQPAAKTGYQLLLKPIEKPTFIPIPSPPSSPSLQVTVSPQPAPTCLPTPVVTVSSSPSSDPKTSPTPLPPAYHPLY